MRTAPLAAAQPSLAPDSTSGRRSGWVRYNDGDEHEAAAYLELPVDLVRAAVAYYDDHKPEIDEWIELNARESDAAYAAWLAGAAADG